MNDRKGKIERCSWAVTDPLLMQYHDDEWGVPDYDSRGLWEQLMLEGFQAGLAWITVLRKGEAFRIAFHQFEPRKVARYQEPDIVRLLGNAGVIRSRAKIEATVKGAQIFLDMQGNGEDFSDFLWSITGGSPIQTKGSMPTQTPLAVEVSSKLRQRGFKFVGPIIVYAFMQAAGFVNDHDPKCFRREEIARLSRR